MNSFFRFKLHHVLVWASIFFLWHEYYAVVDPPQMAWIFATICTTFAAISFYSTYFFLAPIVFHDKNVIRFIGLFLLILIVLAGLRSASIYTAFGLMLPGWPYWSIFNSITTSLFHVGYAITAGCLGRLFIDRYETQKKLDAIARDNLRSELNYLKSQINPHFLFNIHNSIYFLIQENSTRAAEILLKLSNLMKYQLYDCNKDVVPLADEIDHIRNYIDLEKMRVEDVVSVEFTDGIVNKSQMIPPFLFLPIIENAFKHVSQGKTNEIVIYFSQQENCISLDVRNTTNAGKTTNENGLGLKNLRRRLELLYPKNHELLTSNSNGLFETSMKIISQ